MGLVLKNNRGEFLENIFKETFRIIQKDVNLSFMLALKPHRLLFEL